MMAKKAVVVRKIPDSLLKELEQTIIIWCETAVIQISPEAIFHRTVTSWYSSTAVRYISMVFDKIELYSL